MARGCFAVLTRRDLHTDVPHEVLMYVEFCELVRATKGTRVRTDEPVRSLSLFGRRPLLSHCRQQSSGEYAPVNVVGGETVAQRPMGGTFVLTHGLQRRIALNINRASTSSLVWTGASRAVDGCERDHGLGLLSTLGAAPEVLGRAAGVSKLQIGDVRPTLNAASVPRTDDSDRMLPLTILPPRAGSNFGQDGYLRVEAAWDSSAHGSKLLDRLTDPNGQIYLTIQVHVDVDGCATPLVLRKDVRYGAGARARTW